MGGDITILPHSEGNRGSRRGLPISGSLSESLLVIAPGTRLNLSSTYAQAHMLQLFFPLSWVPFPPELLSPLRCITPMLPYVPALAREEYGAQGEECPPYMAHSALCLGTGSVGLVQEEILVDLGLCCQPRKLSQMLNKGRQAGWGLRKPLSSLFWRPPKEARMGDS